MKIFFSSFISVATALASLVVASGQQLTASTSSPPPERLLLSFDHSVPLEHVGDIVNQSGAHVERQLTCTRGLVLSSVDEPGRKLLEATEGFTVVAMPSDAAYHPVRALAGKKKGSGTCLYNDVCPVADPPALLTEANVDRIKSLIRADLVNDETSFDSSKADSMGALLRMVFHDAASFDKNDNGNLSGLNGCVNKDNTGNKGLEGVRAFLGNLKSDLADDEGIVIVSRRLLHGDQSTPLLKYSLLH